MRRIRLVLLVTVAATISLPAQTSTPTPPQSARQALIEMFLSKNAEDFAKHLPEDARRALIHKGETPDTSVVLRISNLGRQMVAQGESIETFEAGPTLLLSEQKDHEKIEVVVERDSLLGEDDEIELSVHLSKDGQPESLPVVPRLIFTLQQEREIWRLTEVTVAAHVPLTDPDYLRSLRKEQDEADESTAQSRLRIIAGAEAAHAARHPDSGYTCTLSNLFPPPPEGEYGPAFADEESNGYRFTLTGCDGNPASKYRITAIPVESDSGLKTFCSDESGTLKSVTGGKSSTCFSRGQVVTTGEGGFYGQD